MAKKTATHDRVEVSPEEKFGSIADVARKYIGQPVAVLCARFNYRGILSAVTEDGGALVLSHARAVESSGASSGSAPANEDIIGSTATISIYAVEIVYQPNWVFAPMDE